MSSNLENLISFLNSLDNETEVDFIYKSGSIRINTCGEKPFKHKNEIFICSDDLTAHEKRELVIALSDKVK